MQNEPGYLTKFQIGKSSATSEHEADWETSVQIVNSVVSQEKVEIKFPAGFTVIVESMTIESTGTFMEPDFNLMEENGQTRYLHHPDPSLTSCRSTLKMYAILTSAVPKFDATKYPCRQSAKEDFIIDSFSEGDFSALPTFERWAEDVLSCSVEGAIISISTPDTLLKTFATLSKRELENRSLNLFRTIDNNASIALYQSPGTAFPFSED